MECKIVVEQKNKLIKAVLSGKLDVKVWEDGWKELLSEIRKLPKGEALGLGDMSNVDSKFFTPEVTKMLGEWMEIVIPQCKKWATVVPSFMLQKSMEHEVTLYSNMRRFVTVQEAQNWLLED